MGGTIAPLAKTPKSPPSAADPSSADSRRASSPKSPPSLTARLSSSTLARTAAVSAAVGVFGIDTATTLALAATKKSSLFSS